MEDKLVNQESSEALKHELRLKEHKISELNRYNDEIKRKQDLEAASFRVTNFDGLTFLGGN